MPSRTYRCDKCDYEKTIYIRGGMLDDEYFQETASLERELRQEVLSGKYGDLMREIASAYDDQLMFRTHETVFQCDHCLNISVERDKRICSKNGFMSDFDIDIKMNVPCKNCGGSLPMRRVFDTMAVCPECGSVMQYISLSS